MSDFLARLIDRTLDRGARLERRQPSIFEPATSAQPSGMTARAEIEETTEETEAAPSGVRRTRPARRAEPEPESPVIEEAADGPAHPSRPARAVSRPPERSKAGDGDSPRTALLQPVEIEGRPERVPPMQEPRLDRSIETTREVRHVERERVIVEERHVIEKAAPGPIVRQEARIDRTILMPPAPPSPRQKESGSVMPTALRIPLVREAAQPAARSQRSPQWAQPVPAPPAPTITVSIGRVEIRAAQPAFPPRPSRPAAPKLSLEDYLRRRTGGVQ